MGRDGYSAMTGTLFVDVDDTLIIWDGTGEGCHPNADVIAAIDLWNGPVVIWSTGGAYYAQQGAEQWLPPEVLSKVTGYDAKWPRWVDDGDMFIDDDPFSSFADATLHPKDIDLVGLSRTGWSMDQ